MDLYQRCIEIYQTIEEEKNKIDQESTGSSYSSFLIFHLGEKPSAVDIRYVFKVLRDFQITPVPNTPDYFLGVTNYKGIFLTVLDGARFCGFDPAPYGFQQCLIVLTESLVREGAPGGQGQDPPKKAEGEEPWRFGIQVHSLETLVRIPTSEVARRESPPETESGGYFSGVLTHNGREVPILDFGRVVLSNALMV